MDEARWRELFDEVREDSRRNTARYEELVTESNGVFRETVRVLRAMADEIREHRAEARADARAHREALFRMLDRMDRLDPGDSTA